MLGLYCVSSWEFVPFRLKPLPLRLPIQQSLGRRPNADLLQALSQLGATIESHTDEGTLPIKIRGRQIHGGKVRISGKKSSQYISALLFLAPLLKEGLEIEIVDELTSASFLDLTIADTRRGGDNCHYQGLLSALCCAWNAAIPAKRLRYSWRLSICCRIVSRSSDRQRRDYDLPTYNQAIPMETPSWKCFLRWECRSHRTENTITARCS